MRSSKKAVLVSIAFILIIVLISFAVTMVWSGPYQDATLRASLAGQIQTLYSGASFGTYAFIPSVIDAELGGTSYNIGGISMTLYGRYAMLQKELSRNPVDTVVIEISYETLTRDQDYDGVEGDVYLLPRLDSFREKLSYFRTHISPDAWDIAYAKDLFLFGRYLKDRFSDGMEISRIHEDNGFVPFPHADVTLTASQITKNRDAKSIDLNFREDNLSQLEELFLLCENNGAAVILCVVPVSDGLLYQKTGWDTLHDLLEEIASEHSCPLLDLNLLKERYSLFNDRDSFGDEDHLCEAGAITFSRTFASLLEQVRSGGDLSGLFYDSYAAMKADSPYLAG